MNEEIEEVGFEEEIMEEDEMLEDMEEARRQRLFSLASNLLKKRDTAVSFRANSGIERQWREDQAAYGIESGTGPNRMIDYATGEATVRGSDGGNNRSSVVVNIIRSRCETAEGRFEDIQLPVDDRNWGLKVTPIPELSDQLKDERPAMQEGKQITDKQGNTKTMADIAKDVRDRAEKAMSLMELVIEDQLSECSYNGESRTGIHNAVVLGTMILKGPNAVKSVSKKWKEKKDPTTGDPYQELESMENISPSSCSVDPWNIYPSPSAKADIQKTAEYIFEKDEVLPRDVRDLIGVDGWDDGQLRLVLSEPPLRNTPSVNDKGRGTDRSNYSLDVGCYEKWEYYGDVTREDLEAMGVDCSHDKNESLSLSACVIFINDRPCKIELNTLDTGHLPYDFWQWTMTNPDSPFGIGVPRILMSMQRIIIGSWRQMMDNAGDSSGASVIALPGIQMADGGPLRIGGKQFYIADENAQDAQKALAQFQINNNQNDLQNIIELALRFVDIETSLPSIFQAETQTAPETLGATNIMVDSSNIGTRRRVKLYDDRITRPHITRYYHYNMQYNPRNEIKGDYNVDARGTSDLLERDQQSQTLLQIFSLKQIPEIDSVTDWKKAVKQYYQSKKLNIMKSDDQIESDQKKAAENPAVKMEPQIEAAKIRTEAMLQQEKMRQQSDISELQFKAEEAQKEREHDKVMKEMDLKIKMLEYSEKRNIALDKLKTQLALGSSGMNLQRELATKKENSVSTVPEVINPSVEPPGRAPVGQSFQR